ISPVITSDGIGPPQRNLVAGQQARHRWAKPGRRWNFCTNSDQNQRGIPGRPDRVEWAPGRNEDQD
ncbi:MAG: hypothetical protein M3325_10965, partial [Actinomycetota bacterium]|nr:hypothetical protein [Actinomycetota bacterium]